MIDYLYFRNCEGDWEGFYVNGELVEEGHSIDFAWVVEHYLHGTYVNDDEGMAGEYLEKFGGRCPDNTNELLRVLGGDE